MIKIFDKDRVIFDAEIEDISTHHGIYDFVFSAAFVLGANSVPDMYYVSNTETGVTMRVTDYLKEYEPADNYYLD